MDINNENVVSDLVFKQLQLDETNAECFDCGSPQPQWASVNNGTFICMQCAALHRQMGLHISIVRSLSMDSWNMNQLKQMALGGNKKLKAYFQNYDLNEESVQQRYNTRAAEFYRLNLRSQCENMPFGDKQPSYEIGREQIPGDEVRAPEVMYAKLTHEQQQAQNETGDYLSYLNTLSEKAATVTSVLQSKAEVVGANENVQYAKESIKNLGENENVKYAKDSIYNLGSKATNKAFGATASLQQSYQEGTLKQKASENASWAAGALSGKASENASWAYGSLSGIGSSLYKKAATLTGQEVEQAEGQGESPDKQEDLIQFAGDDQNPASQPKPVTEDLINLTDNKQ